MPTRTICILAAILFHTFSGKAQDSLKSSNIPIVITIISSQLSETIEEKKDCKLPCCRRNISCYKAFYHVIPAEAGIFGIDGDRSMIRDVCAAHWTS